MQRFKGLGLPVSFVGAWLAGCLTAQAMASGAMFDIAAGSAPTTLKEFAAQAHVQLLYDYRAVQALKTPAVKGHLEPTEALKVLLRGSGFTFRQINDRTIAVMAPGASTSSLRLPDQPPSTTASGDNDGKQSSSEVSRVAQVDQGTNRQSTPSASSASSQQLTPLQEVIVTAQKREERLQDVPIPVSVISAEALTENNQVTLADYYSQIPGLSTAGGIMSTQTLSIRGITTGAIQGGPPNPSPTVGVTVDDVPFGGSGGGDQAVPDFDPGDLARVEVLRGPQGTLYGASSMGGLIKYVTLDPSTDSLSGRLVAGTDSVYNGAELGYTFRGSVNLPLSSDFAVRASVFTRQDAGYIDNPIRQIDGINEDHASGGHLAALWRPSDTFSLKLSALFQYIKSDGTNDVTPNPPPIYGVHALGDLQQYYIAGLSPDTSQVQAYSAVLTYKVGSAELTSLTGYNVYAINTSTDITSLYAPFIPNFESYFGTIGVNLNSRINFDRFTQELRLAAQLGDTFDGLVGAFYSHEADHFKWLYPAPNVTTGAILGSWGTVNFTDAPITYTEYSAFADLTYHVTDRIDVQIGGRESHYEIVGDPQTYVGLQNTVIFGLPSENVVVFPEYTLRQNAFTYLLTPRFKISSDLMAYARLASGYRPGGSNAGTFGVPQEYSPDKTQDYDIGAKGDFLERTLSVDASLYYIDWKNIQLPLVNPSNGESYTGNAAAAKSQGLELSVESRPVAGLTIAGWVTWSEAVLTQTIPGAGQNGVVYGFAGDRLPNAPRFSGNLSVNDEFPLVRELKGFVGGTIGYVGDRLDAFSAASPERTYLPPYARTDLRAGTKYDSWTVNFYVNNVTDKRGLISGGIGNVIPFNFYYIQPRTVGLSVSKKL